MQKSLSPQAGSTPATIVDTISLAEHSTDEATIKLDPKTSETTEAVVPDPTLSTPAQTLLNESPTTGPLAEEKSSLIPNPAFTSSVSLDSEKPASSDAMSAMPSSALEGLLKFSVLSNHFFERLC